MSDSTAQKSTRNNKVVGIVAAVLAMGLIYLLLDAGTVDLLSASVPVWLVAVVSYLLGVAAGWGYLKK